MAERDPSMAAEPGWVRAGTTGLSLALVGFILYTAVAGQYATDIQRGLPFALVAALILLRHPVVPGARWLRLVDAALGIGAVYAVSYVSINADAIMTRFGRTVPEDVAASLIGLVVLFEIARRTVGLMLPLIALVFSLYAIFGQFLPDPFGHRGLSLGRVALAAWVGTDGVFGIAFGVMVGVVYVYMLLAAMMERSGAGQALLQLARALTGGARSGAGLTTVVGSGMFGMASGSGVADVAAIGPANIPAMKRAGYRADFAAAVQALASIGAQIMPPVMGSSAFIIAELTSTPYAQVALMAVIPALLYYACVAAAVHFDAMRLGLGTEAGTEARLSPLQSALAIAPLVVLILFLVEGASPARAALWSILALLALSALDARTRFSPRLLVATVRQGTVNSIPLWTATAVIGVIVSAVGLTGAATQISLAVVALAKDSLFLALAVTMLASLILGTALPTIAAYLLLVIMVAPALEELGLPLVVAHLFVFFYGVTSDLTPPTALAPLTASAIAGTGFWRTCWITMRIGLPIFLIPFAFVYNPALLLMGTWWEIAASATMATCGVVAFAIGTIGYAAAPLSWPARAAMMTAGVGMLFNDVLVAGPSFTVAAALLVLNRRRATPAGPRSA